ncbi:MAG: energy-coupling factor transporter ATPase [Clostridia bacterium]|nr:energy-coupling factor transporter ATPase [Clostridia bacterium]
MIEVLNLGYTYSKGGLNEKEALHDINLTINDGEFCGLIGHTGSGKTTLVQIISGLLKPTSGSVLIDGLDISDKTVKNTKLKGKVGLVFQYPEYQLFEETCFKDAAFGPKNLGCDEEETKRRVIDAFRLVGVEPELYEKSPFDLSGGQKRRVAIAGVLAMEPDVLVLDEPTAGLDPAGRDDLLMTLKKLHEERKNTVILVSHSMEDMAKVADRIIVMNKGEMAMDGTPREVFSRNTELKDMGLNIPEISRVILRLRKNGVDIRPDIYTVEEAKTELLKLIKRKQDVK